MTKEEREQGRQLKAESVAQLQGAFPALLESYKETIVETDVRLFYYVREIATHPDKHNLYEILAVRRFFDMLGRYGWSRSRVKTFIRF